MSKIDETRDKSYTESLSDLMWDFVFEEDDAEDDYSRVIQCLSGMDFRPFSERLLSFFNRITEHEYSSGEAGDVLLALGASRGVRFNRNTVKNWFSSSSPKKGQQDRERAYQIAFALNLDLPGAVELLHKVYLDRAFNLRNASEAIYFYCIKNGKPYSNAQLMLAQLNNQNDDESSEEIIPTLQIKESINLCSEDEDVVAFIKSRPRDFSLSNTLAKEKLDKLISELKGGLVVQEYKMRIEEAIETAGRDLTSIDFMLYMITNQDSSSKNADFFDLRKLLPREVTSNFPNKQTFSLTNPSSDIIRKELIMLYFYKYWVTLYLEDGVMANTDYEHYDAFIAQVNMHLDECGLGTLYKGNPHDWLYMYCSGKVNPLDAFRGILAS